MQELEVYASIECPYAYLATYRLARLRDEWEGKVRIWWRALSLEYVNSQSYSKPLYEAEYALFKQIEPDLPWRLWERAEWEWPTTFWPAFEALACAQAQGPAPAFEMSLALRQAHFAECRNISLRHELLLIAERLARKGKLDLGLFTEDWDQGRYKHTVLAESRKGWHDLKLDGSATFVRADGRRATNPALGEIDFDEQRGLLKSFSPFKGDPLEIYRDLVLGG
jgi:predicted DsbA family dithiol-disulfide isomerase